MIALPDGPTCVADFFKNGGSPFLVIALLLVIPHVAAIASLYLRWGALSIGIGSSIGLLVVCESAFQWLNLSPQDVILILMTIAIFGISAICHIAVRLRVEAISVR